jgi:uncharacterized membrane protein YbhN (UPF0104 family)
METPSPSPSPRGRGKSLVRLPESSPIAVAQNQRSQLVEAGEAAGDLTVTLRRQVTQPRALTSILVTLVIAYLVARKFLGPDLGEAWARLRAADLRLLALALLIFYSSVVVRTLRWEKLLANVGYRRSPGLALPTTAGLCKIVFLAWFANSITIGQVGDVVRGFLLKRKVATISFTATLGTIVAERLLDVVVLLALLSGSALLAFQGELPRVAVDALGGGVIVASIGAAVLLSMYRFGPLLKSLLPARLLAPYANLEHGVIGSFQGVPVLLLYTTAGWLIEATTILLAGAAIGAPLSIPAALVVATLASLLGVVSITPGGLGVTEAGIILILGKLGVDPGTAAAVAVLNRVINYWSVTVFGVLVYAVTGM